VQRQHLVRGPGREGLIDVVPSEIEVPVEAKDLVGLARAVEDGEIEGAAPKS